MHMHIFMSKAYLAATNQTVFYRAPENPKQKIRTPTERDYRSFNGCALLSLLSPGLGKKPLHLYRLSAARSFKGGICGLQKDHSTTTFSRQWGNHVSAPASIPGNKTGTRECRKRTERLLVDYCAGNGIEALTNRPKLSLSCADSRL